MKKVTIITGHYGSGKTTISVNLALELAQKGEKVTIVDFDFVNPYFRTSDFAKLLSDNKVSLVSSIYANSNVDIPAVSFDLERLCSENGYVIIDVGGDDAGATALGRYKRLFDNLALSDDLDMWNVINKHRFLTDKTENAVEYIYEIEAASRLKHTGIINNSNLSYETDENVCTNALDYGKEVSEKSNLPLVFTSFPADKSFSKDNFKGYKFIKAYVQPVWEH